MARSEGFEPSTAWFVARYSIQLSYERADLISINEYQVSDLIFRNSGASWRIRTSDRLVRSQVLYPAELRTHGVFNKKRFSSNKIMARSEGFEPSTAWFVARYSIQLSYERAVFDTEITIADLTSFARIMARSEGFEPSTAWFVARYSIQLSYERADLRY